MNAKRSINIQPHLTFYEQEREIWKLFPQRCSLWYICPVFKWTVLKNFLLVSFESISFKYFHRPLGRNGRFMTKFNAKIRKIEHMPHLNPLWTRMPSLMLFLPRCYLRSSNIFHYLPSLYPLLPAGYGFARRRGKSQLLYSGCKIVQQVRHRSLSMW